MSILKLQTMRRVLLRIRSSIDEFVALIDAELHERGASHDRATSDRSYQQPR